MPAPSFQTDAPKPAGRNPVREKVAGEKGIYRRRNADDKVVHEIAYRDRTGKQKWETVHGGIKEARRRRAELVSKRPEERQARSREIFADAAETWLANRLPKLRTRTARLHRDSLDNLLLPRFGRTRLVAIDADAIAALTRELQAEGLHCVDPARPVRPLSAPSVRNYLKPLRGTLALAARRQWIPSNPFDVLTEDDQPVAAPPKQEHEWSPEDLVALIDAASTLAAKPMCRYDYTPLLRVSATLGPRLSEALGWTWADFDKCADDGAGVLHVRRQWLRTGEYGPTKTPAGVRVLPLPSDLRDLLIALRLRSRYSADTDPIFSSLTGKPLGHWNVPARGFVPARDLAGLPKSVTFHCLRDAAASRLINAGLDPVAVAKFLGHEDATTTLRKYARLWDRRRTGDAVRAALAGSETVPCCG
jgi:integrase